MYTWFHFVHLPYTWFPFPHVVSSVHRLSHTNPRYLSVMPATSLLVPGSMLTPVINMKRITYCSRKLNVTKSPVVNLGCYECVFSYSSGSPYNLYWDWVTNPDLPVHVVVYPWSFQSINNNTILAVFIFLCKSSYCILRLSDRSWSSSTCCISGNTHSFYIPLQVLILHIETEWPILIFQYMLLYQWQYSQFLYSSASPHTAYWDWVTDPDLPVNVLSISDNTHGFYIPL